jgi:hypothetical protein
MLERIGDVCYWLGNGAAVLAFAFWTFIAGLPPPGQPLQSWDWHYLLDNPHKWLIFALGTAFALWLAGRGCRYILAGK